MSRGCFHVASKTFNAVQSVQSRINVTKLRSFLGLCDVYRLFNVYRRFVSNFSQIAAPLTKKLCNENLHTFPDMNETEMNSSRHLQESLVKPPVLALPLCVLTYILDTNACDRQLGTVHMQRYEDKSLLTTGYYSRTQMEAKLNNDTNECECLAILWAVLLLRLNLYGTHFEIRTVQDSLLWILHLDTQSARLSPCNLRLQELDFALQLSM